MKTFTMPTGFNDSIVTAISVHAPCISHGHRWIEVATDTGARWIDAFYVAPANMQTLCNNGLAAFLTEVGATAERGGVRA